MVPLSKLSGDLLFLHTGDQGSNASVSLYSYMTQRSSQEIDQFWEREGGEVWQRPGVRAKDSKQQ